MTEPPPGQWDRLTEIFERDRLRLIRSVQDKLFGSRGDAEDIVSDMFLRLIERSDLLGTIEDLAAYLHRALDHSVVDFFRRRRNVAFEELDDNQPAGEPDPETCLLADERRRHLRAALLRLAPAERALWLAVEMEGLRFKDLAARWGRPMGTLLSRKSRATKRLRELLDDPPPPPRRK